MNAARTRGRRRRVRVRGGAAPQSVRMEEVKRSRKARSRQTDKGRQHNDSVVPCGSDVRPPGGSAWPHTIEEFTIQDISEKEIARVGLLHPKRRCLGQKSNLTAVSPTPSSSSPVAFEVVSPVADRPRTTRSTSVSPASECGPSPVSECGGNDAQSADRSPPRQVLDVINYGSESDSDESDVEDGLVAPFFPRTYRGIMETPTEDGIAVYPPDDLSSATTESDSTEFDTMATEQPWSLCDFLWKDFPNPPIPPKSRREKFSQSDVGPTTPCVDPYDIFIAIWDRQFMEHIASETNRYAQQVAAKMLADHKLHPNSRINRWFNTNADELYVYMGIVLAMGVVIKSSLDEYWNTTPSIFYTPGFSAHMSINRFKLLNTCIHFSNNEDMCALKLEKSEAKLYKIQPVLSHLNLKFGSLYVPRQNLALDESILQWKGGLDINQLIPNKVSNVGVKTYELCESQTGYLWRFEAQCHKKSPPQQPNDPINTSTPAIVLRLLQGLENKGYTVWMDNFYNSPYLARRLKAIGFDCAGTLRTNRKFVPQALQCLTKGNMRQGEISGLTSGDVDVMVWRDNNRVATISTYHGNVAREYEGFIKPSVILDYNIMMGGVDKKDQMMAMYPMERKRTRVWYKKLFRRLLNISVFNSYIIHRESPSPLTKHNHRQFRIHLIQSLLSKHKLSLPLPQTPRPANMRNERVNVDHRVLDFAKIDGRRVRRLCEVCRKRIQTYCVGCNRTVCPDPCFVSLHT